MTRWSRAHHRALDILMVAAASISLGQSIVCQTNQNPA